MENKVEKLLTDFCWSTMDHVYFDQGSIKPNLLNSTGIKEK
jgi:hypothetical protein